MGNTLSSYSQKTLFLLSFFFPPSNDNQETQNGDDEESQNSNDVETQNGNNQERQNGNYRERQPTILSINQLRQVVHRMRLTPNNTIPRSLFSAPPSISHGEMRAIPNFPIPYVPIRNFIPLTAVGRIPINIPNNTEMIHFLISLATSANHILLIFSGEGYISDAVVTPPGQETRHQFLGPRRTRRLTGTILPSNLNRDRLGQNRVMETVDGTSVQVPNVSTVMITLSSLEGEGHEAHHLITYGLFTVLAILFRIDDLGAPPGRLSR